MIHEKKELPIWNGVSFGFTIIFVCFFSKICSVRLLLFLHRDEKEKWRERAQENGGFGQDIAKTQWGVTEQRWGTERYDRDYWHTEGSKWQPSEAERATHCPTGEGREADEGDWK